MAGFLVALRCKGESPPELLGFLDALMQAAVIGGRFGFIFPEPAAHQPGGWAGRVGRPAAFHASKPPSRSVASRRPIRRSVAAARVEA